MLKIKEVETKASELVDIYSNIENDLITNIASRLKYSDDVTDIAEWQVQKLLEIGSLNKANIKAISKQSGKSIESIKDILKTAGYGSIQGDEAMYEYAHSEGVLSKVPLNMYQSENLKHIYKSALVRTVNKMNLVNTTARESAQQAFTDAINQTYLEVISGISDYKSAIRKAVSKMSEKGIKGAKYISGAGKETHNYIDTAVRRAVLTSSSQLAGDMQLERAREWGSDLVEVTSHMGARPSHAEWQGQIYSLSGKHPKYKEFTAATKYGDITGLKGVNCSHDFYPFFEGLSTRSNYPIDKDENEKAYLESQEQRKIERKIRKEKRKIIAAEASGDPAAVLKYNKQLQQRQREMRQFIGNTKRTRRRDREQLFGYNRGEVGRAKESLKSPSLKGINDNIALQKKGNPKGYDNYLKIKYHFGTNLGKDAYIKYVPKDSIASSTYDDIEHYRTSTGKIYMNFENDNENLRGRGVTFFHEHGHMIDYEAGYISNNQVFRNKIYEDVNNKINYVIDLGYTKDEAYKKIAEELKGHHNSSISDLFGGATNNQIIGHYRHDVSYWKDDPTALTCEAFAHCYEAQFSLSRRRQLEMYMPNTLREFEKLLKGVVYK